MKKKSYLKTLAIIAVFAIAVVASSAVVVNATGDNTGDNKGESKGSDEARSVTMKANGDFIVTGVIVNSVASSTNTINVRFYGFNRDVNVSGARIIGGGQKITIADFKTGDKLSGKGNYNENTRVITVTEINNLSHKSRNVSSLEARIQELLNLVRQLQEKLKNLTR